MKGWEKNCCHGKGKWPHPPLHHVSESASDVPNSNAVRQTDTWQAWHDHVGVTNIEEFFNVIRTSRDCPRRGFELTSCLSLDRLLYKLNILCSQRKLAPLSRISKSPFEDPSPQLTSADTLKRARYFWFRVITLMPVEDTVRILGNLEKQKCTSKK